jgi:hypothetical protein
MYPSICKLSAQKVENNVHKLKNNDPPKMNNNQWNIYYFTF